MSSLKRSASLYSTRSSTSSASSSQHMPVIKRSNLNETSSEMNPSRLLRNKYKLNHQENLDNRENNENDDSVLNVSKHKLTKTNSNILAKKQQLLNLSLSDCTCPICLEVLVEPVRMPCTHELCLPCFKAMTDQTNFLCPMCRMRISTWSRYASNTNTLVNKERWEQIQQAFPNEIKMRIEGKTAIALAESLKTMQQKSSAAANQSTETSSTNKNCSKPGEIRKEYQEYLKREEEKLKQEKETEEKLSLELIQQLIREEENLSLDDYINAIGDSNNQNQDIPTTSTCTNTRLFSRLNSHILKTSKLSNQINSNANRNEIETKLLSRPVLVAQSSRNILNNHNVRNNTPILPSISKITRSHSTRLSSTNTPTTSSTSENVPIALSIKLNPRNSIKKSREEVKTVLDRLRQNRPYYSNSNDNDDDSICVEDKNNSNNNTIKRRLRTNHQRVGASSSSSQRTSHDLNDSSNTNNKSYSSSNDESANSSIISTMSSMSLRSRKL